MPPTSPRRAATPPLAALACLALALASAWAPTAARADIVLDFDVTPNLPLAPNTFTNPRQDLSVPNLVEIVGGTSISSPSFLASFAPGGGVRNGYGTRSGTANNYVQNLRFDFDNQAVVTNVRGTLFNGFTDLNSYTVRIFNGASQVGATTFADVEENTNTAGFRAWNLSASRITRLEIVPDTTFSGGAWNYVVDNVRVEFTQTAIPEPATWNALVMCLGLAVALRTRRRAA